MNWIKTNSLTPVKGHNRESMKQLKKDFHTALMKAEAKKTAPYQYDGVLDDQFSADFNDSIGPWNFKQAYFQSGASRNVLKWIRINSFRTNIQILDFLMIGKKSRIIADDTAPGRSYIESVIHI